MVGSKRTALVLLLHRIEVEVLRFSYDFQNVPHAQIRIREILILLS